VVDARWPNSVEGAEASALRAAWAEAAGDASTALKASWQQVERSTQGPRQAALGAVADRAARLGRAADEQRALMLYREDYPFAQDGLARRLREARLLINAGEAAAARAQLRALQTEAVGEEAAELQYRLAEAAEAAGDLPGAVLEYEKTAHLDPPGGLDWGASALFQAARAWRELGREDAAEHSLREVLRREGEDSAHGRRAKVELEALKGGEAK
jgi:tetratricopeptide (TPR) repeat protein